MGWLLFTTAVCLTSPTLIYSFGSRAISSRKLSLITTNSTSKHSYLSPSEQSPCSLEMPFFVNLAPVWLCIPWRHRWCFMYAFFSHAPVMVPSTEETHSLSFSLLSFLFLFWPVMKYQNSVPLTYSQSSHYCGKSFGTYYNRAFLISNYLISVLLCALFHRGRYFMAFCICVTIQSVQDLVGV